MNYRAMMRRKLLESIYDKMSDEEKRLFVQMSIKDKDHNEIMSALQRIDKKADSNHHSFALDLAANVAGNGIWSSIIWLGSKLLKRL